MTALVLFLIGGVDAKHDCRMPVRQSSVELAVGLTLRAEIIPPAITCQSGKLGGTPQFKIAIGLVENLERSHMPQTPLHGRPVTVYYAVARTDHLERRRRNVLVEETSQGETCLQMEYGKGNGCGSNRRAWNPTSGFTTKRCSCRHRERSTEVTDRRRGGE